MKKNALIKLLNDIEGNPDIKLWNGLVGDYTDIDKELVPLELVKETPEFLLSCLEGEYIRDNKVFKITDEKREELKIQADDIIKNHRDWELPNQFVEEENFERWYGTKRTKIVIINAKTKGKTYQDRLGSITY